MAGDLPVALGIKNMVGHVRPLKRGVFHKLISTRITKNRDPWGGDLGEIDAEVSVEALLL